MRRSLFLAVVVLATGCSASVRRPDAGSWDGSSSSAEPVSTPPVRNHEAAGAATAALAAIRSGAVPSVATMAVFPVQLVAARPNPGVSCYAEYQRHEESVLAPGDLVEAVRRLELRLPPEPTGEEVVDSETTDIVFDVPAYWAKARMHRQPDGAWRLVRIETWRGSYDP